MLSDDVKFPVLRHRHSPNAPLHKLPVCGRWSQVLAPHLESRKNTRRVLPVVSLPGELLCVTSSHCKPITVEEPMLLKSTFLFPVQLCLHVALVSDSNILFGPEVPSGMCAGNPSLLMTQPSSPSAQSCNYFCDVPRTCRYSLKEEIGNYIIYHFYCNCISNSYSELPLMLRPESVTGTVSICKLDV